jgi:hypothetical protein
VFPFFIAHILFWAFLLIGASDMDRSSVAIYVGLWLAGYVATHWMSSGGLVFVSYVALLDVALVFHVFKGDIRF